MTDSIDISKKVYEAEDIQKLLGLGRSKTYEFLDEVFQKQEPFRVIKIGKLYRIPCRSVSSRLESYIEFPVSCLTDGFTGNRKSKV